LRLADLLSGWARGDALESAAGLLLEAGFWS
jgi:hypothetical protein